MNLEQKSLDGSNLQITAHLSVGSAGTHTRALDPSISIDWPSKLWHLGAQLLHLVGAFPVDL